MKFLLILTIFSFTLTINQVWAQDSEEFGEGLFEDPLSFFEPENRIFAFLLFIIGIAIYSLFVWYFYRYISKRDLFPRIFYQFSLKQKDKSKSIAKLVSLTASYAFLFPLIIFVWFTLLAFFVFLIGEDMPFQIAIFVSMAVIGVVRILSYYREDAAKEVAKMIPYAILSFLLTSAAVYSNPNFFTEKQFQAIPHQFVEHLEGIIAAILLISIFEYGFRIAFIVKRRFYPVIDKKLEVTIEEEIDERLNIHYKKITDDAKNLKKQIEENKREISKIKEVQKRLVGLGAKKELNEDSN